MADTDYFGKDKLKHFFACLILAIIHPYLAVGPALTKEWCDYKAHGNHWCWWDILADTFGTVIGTIIWYFIWFRLLN